jgi:aspartate/methionine/tyrosine aminotransferase
VTGRAGRFPHGLCDFEDLEREIRKVDSPEKKKYKAVTSLHEVCNKIQSITYPQISHKRKKVSGFESLLILNITNSRLAIMGSKATVMDLSTRASLLSSRGEKIEKETNKVEMWKVIQDLWDPKDNPNGYVSLGMAENWLMRKQISQHIRDNFDPPGAAFTYGDGPTGSKRLKEAVAKFVTHNFAAYTEVKAEHVTMTNGTSAALEHLSFALSNPGDVFLPGRPYYGNYEPDYTWRFDAKLFPVSFDKDDSRFDESCVRAYEDAIKEALAKKLNVAALILCHPHNPLGRCYPRHVIIELMKLCQSYKIHFICDEIYALSTWDNKVDKSPPPVPFESALSINLDGIIDGHRVHVIWGMSKDFGANGIRVGALISQYNIDLHKALVAVGLYTSVSSLSDCVSVKLLEDEDWLLSYFPENQRRLSDSFTKIARWCQNNNINYAKGVCAGFFIWVDLGSKYRERHHVDPSKDVTDLILEALKQKKVFLASGRDFGAEKHGWFRIIFSVSDYYLFEGLKRIIEALQ